ncbi:MAG: hypothetical protein AB1657_02375 [Candidatus Micrarchaeota archaeon]
MTTRNPAFHEHLGPGHLKQALVAIAREMFGSRDPLVEKAMRAEFHPALPVEIFAERGRLGEGMGKLLFQAMDAEARAEREVRRLLGGFAGMEPHRVASFVVCILVNTRSEDAFFHASETARRIARNPWHVQGFRDGSMLSGFEFMRVCAMEEFGFADVIMGAELGRRRDVAHTARVLARAANDGWGPNSFFHGVFRIGGTSFAEHCERLALLSEYVDACRVLAGCCPQAVVSLDHYLGLAVRDESDGQIASALIRRFTEADSLARLRSAGSDSDRLLEAIAGIVGLEEKKGCESADSPN